MRVIYNIIDNSISLLGFLFLYGNLYVIDPPGLCG